MEVSRAALLESSARAFAAMDTAQLRRPLRIRFIGESAIDAGGVGREWFELVANALFEPALGLFAHAQTDHMTYTINPATAAGLAPFAAAARAFGTLQGAYRFAGRFLGKAMLEEKSLPVHLSRPLYKHLLGVPVTHRDLKFVDRKLAENLQWLRGHQNVEVLSLDFTTVEESGHAAKGRERYQVVELKPGGRDILVTDANKHEFCEISTKFKLLDRISPQLAAMLSGFYEVIPPGLLVVFDPQELELLLCGLDAIDVDDWAAHTALLGTLRPTHRLVRWFWDVVREFDQPTRARLLQFVTGTSRVPLGGFRELQGVDGEVRLFTLAALPAPAYGEGAYPVAHTCFNRLDLPPYGDRETLRAKLAEVIELELRTGFGKE
ncbi:ubiquitin protein ligase [Tribonema minus]|uniref:HECT-type E3 ubiquitin transferase n=1 Tax=Tribonema minus TaxID=303371 RepID=A0A836CIZ9_9STRA|nr:ubiquitin protein ligase [Tribonema minus]